MNLNKWDYKRHMYKKHEVPDSWNCKTYSTDLEETINCASCGKELKFGDSYTSLEIHTDIGFGYGVCQRCYDNEFLRKSNYI